MTADVTSTLARHRGRSLLLLAVVVIGGTGSSAAAERPMWTPVAAVDRTAETEPAATNGYVPRIFNGVSSGDYPAVVAVVIQFSPTQFGLCSGTLVAPAVVVTAAHCVDGPLLRIVVAFLLNGQQENHAVAAFAVHPRHVPGTLLADIAVLELTTAVAGVTPIPLAHVRPRPGRTGTIVGFGEDASGEVGRRQAGTVRVGRCPRALRQAGIRQLGTVVCWRADRGGSGICEGDSGGPLLVNGKLAGVTSASTSAACGPSRVDVDTSVAGYRSWIEAHLQ